MIPVMPGFILSVGAEKVLQMMIGSKSVLIIFRPDLA